MPSYHQPEADKIELSACSHPSNVSEGESVTFTVEATNHNDTDVYTHVVWRADGVIITGGDATIRAGGTTTVTSDITPWDGLVDIVEGTVPVRAEVDHVNSVQLP